MRPWIFLYLMVPYLYGHHITESEYECGAHGRFEYCIDGVPGCVVGCHCHPGYYFDTNTKICEPNIRLSQHYRRNYDTLEPTRVFIPSTPPVIEDQVTTVSNAVDEKIDIMTKDADELGDWLYNQFFKAIENQVINETKDDSILTRRSEIAPPTFVKKPTRRSHRYWRARRKKKKKKKRKGLKSKLLRITEDDSLFDSSSSSTSDESSDSSDSSSVSESRDFHESHENSNEKNSKTLIKSDHGHKKIVVFNKRPKPPLPSFIFLPNMETPFFPPIGLPPPMPMYPMVPVPPMMGPFPFPVPVPAPNTEKTKTNGNDDANLIQPEHTTHHTTTSTSTYPPKTPSPNDTQITQIDNTQSNETQIDNKEIVETQVDNTQINQPGTEVTEDNIQKDNKTEVDNTDKVNENIGRTKKRRGPKNKLANKLREKLKKKNKVQNYFANKYQGPPMFPPGFLHNHIPNMRAQHKVLPEMNMEEDLAGLQDVDFKYLSQLIHKANLNKTNHYPPTAIPTAEIRNVAQPNRRTNYDNYPYQITQVLNSLTNQPINRVPENQHAYDSSDQLSYNVPNQTTYNLPNHFANQSNDYEPSQPDYNTPSQPNYNAPNQLNYNAFNQPNYNAPNQLKYNAPNHLDYNALNHPSYNINNQRDSNANGQPTYVSLNQPHKISYRKKIEDTNDVYYSNLGRQIASMIRNIDADKEVDIEIKSSLNKPISGGRSGPRSYWERSVRSPYTHIMNSYKNQINSLKLSNEDLFSLENKVEIAASTEPTRSLHELENIISKMQKAKSIFFRMNGGSRRATQPSQSSFNVNLLPGNNQQFHSNNKITLTIPPKQPTPKKLFNNAKTARRNVHPLEPPQIVNSLLRDFMFTLQASDEIINETTPKINPYQPIAPGNIPTRIPEPVTAQPDMYKMQNPHFKLYAYTALPLPPKVPLLKHRKPPYVQATTSRTYYQQLSPVLLNHKSVNYFNGVYKNQYLYEKAPVPLRPQSFPSIRRAPVSRYDTYGKIVRPSYVHRELHHFDYFDDFL